MIRSKFVSRFCHRPWATAGRGPRPRVVRALRARCLHLAIQNETPVEGVVLFVDRAAINFAKKDQRERLEHGLGCVGEQVADANQQSVLPHPRRMCQSGERKELDVHFRKGCSRFELEMRSPEDRFELKSHSFGSEVQSSGSWEEFSAPSGNPRSLLPNGRSWL